MKKKIARIALLIMFGMAMAAFVMTRSAFSIEKFKKISYFQQQLGDQSEHQMRTFSPLWHSITRRFLP